MRWIRQGCIISLVLARQPALRPGTKEMVRCLTCRTCHLFGRLHTAVLTARCRRACRPPTAAWSRSRPSSPVPPTAHDNLPSTRGTSTPCNTPSLALPLPLLPRLLCLRLPPQLLSRPHTNTVGGHGCLHDCMQQARREAGRAWTAPNQETSPVSPLSSDAVFPLGPQNARSRKSTVSWDRRIMPANLLVPGLSTCATKEMRWQVG